MDQRRRQNEAQLRHIPTVRKNGRQPVHTADRCATRQQQVHKPRRTLAEQATTEQLLQALKYGQNCPEAGWQIGEHIIKLAEATQLTAQIVEQLPWQGFFVHYTDMPTALTDDDTWRRYRQTIELVQQELLDEEDDAWTILHGISEHGQTIDDIAELALAIAQKQRRA